VFVATSFIGLFGFFTAPAGGTFTAAFLVAAFFRALFFFAAVSCASATSALFSAMAFFVAAFDGGLEWFTGGFSAVPEDACKLTASFARVTAAFAS
jgi:hypothetical protein